MAISAAATIMQTATAKIKGRRTAGRQRAIGHPIILGMRLRIENPSNSRESSLPGGVPIPRISMIDSLLELALGNKKRI
jgi:hypothetical protein